MKISNSGMPPDGSAFTALKKYGLLLLNDPARKCCKLESRSTRNGRLSPSGSGGKTEEACNERDLPSDAVFRQPRDLSLANHVHRLDTLNRARR